MPLLHVQPSVNVCLSALSCECMCHGLHVLGHGYSLAHRRVPEPIVWARAMPTLGWHKERANGQELGGGTVPRA